MGAEVMTNSELKVLVVDDEPERAQRWASKLLQLGIPNAKFSASTISDAEALVKSLNRRRGLARKNLDWRKETCLLDDIDILLIDFDLIGLGSSEFTTGEEVAYLARILSSVKTICVINQFRTNRFDLTMNEDLGQRSDLDIGSEQIANPGLWKAFASWSGFRPWFWPILTSEVGLYSQRVADVHAHLDTGIMEFFGFQSSDVKPTRMLPKSCFSYFRGKPSEVTVGMALSCSSFVHPRDIDWLKQDPIQTELVVAAVLHKWLERWVLARQDVLVDIPHMVARKPWLLDNPQDSSAWTRMMTPEAAALLPQVLEKCRFERQHWLSRSAYWGEDVSSSILGFPPPEWQYDRIPDLVFREDVSNFGSRADSSEFDCQLGSSYDLRYVLKVDGVDYSPAVRLAM
jgi:hypothetical protein